MKIKDGKPENWLDNAAGVSLNPKEDITTYELAQFISVMEVSLNDKVLTRMPTSVTRHLRAITKQEKQARPLTKLRKAMNKLRGLLEN